MLLPRVLLLPSTPTLLIDERRGTLTDMLAAFADQARRFDEDIPEAIVIVTSRWLGGGLFHADDSKRHTSVIDLPGFGVEPRYDGPGEPALARAIVKQGRCAGLPSAVAHRGADTGVSVSSRTSRHTGTRVRVAARRAWAARSRNSANVIARVSLGDELSR